MMVNRKRENKLRKCKKSELIIDNKKYWVCASKNTGQLTLYVMAENGKKTTPKIETYSKAISSKLRKCPGGTFRLVEVNELGEQVE